LRESFAQEAPVVPYSAQPIKQGEATMRKFVISIATLAALITLAGMSSAVTVLSLSQPHFAADGTNADGHSIDFTSFLTIGR